MRKSVKEKCDLLIANRKVFCKAFVGEFDVMRIGGSLIMTEENKEADLAALRNCKKIIKKNENIFSSFRSVCETINVAKMALSRDPEQYYQDVKTVYKALNRGVFSNGNYTVLTAENVCDAGRVAEADALVEKFTEITKRMKKEHPVLTGAEDWSLAMLLAMTSKDVDTVIAEMEECFSYMKDMKARATDNAIQGLSQVLTLLDGDMKTKCDKVTELLEKFRIHGYKYGKNYEFPAIGTLVGIQENADVLAEEVIEAAEYLRTHRGFGTMSLDKAGRLMFATVLVASALGLEQAATAGVAARSVVNNAITDIVVTQITIFILCCMAASVSH